MSNLVAGRTVFNSGKFLALAKEKAKKEMLNKITEAAIQWSVAGLLGAAWYWMQTHYKP